MSSKKSVKRPASEPKKEAAEEVPAPPPAEETASAPAVVAEKPTLESLLHVQAENLTRLEKLVKELRAAHKNLEKMAAPPAKKPAKTKAAPVAAAATSESD